MAVEITVDYQGQLRCGAVHGPSKNELLTDAPADNMGKGAAFSPTDLVATAMATCMVTTIGIVAQRKGVEIKNMRAHVEKHMSTDAPRRIVKLPVKLWISLPPDYPERALLENAAHTCPVRQSVKAEMEVPIEFFWEG
jgi:uncharacterized OsmC-like protein